MFGRELAQVSGPSESLSVLFPQQQIEIDCARGGEDGKTTELYQRYQIYRKSTYFDWLASSPLPFPRSVGPSLVYFNIDEELFMSNHNALHYSLLLMQGMDTRFH